MKKMLLILSQINVKMALQAYSSNLPSINISDNTQVALSSASVLAIVTFLAPSLLTYYVPNALYALLWQFIVSFLPTFIAVYVFMEHNEELMGEVAQMADKMSPVISYAYSGVRVGMTVVNDYPKTALATYSAYITLPWVYRILYLPRKVLRG